MVVVPASQLPRDTWRVEPMTLMIAARSSGSRPSSGSAKMRSLSSVVSQAIARTCGSVERDIITSTG